MLLLRIFVENYESIILNEVLEYLVVRHFLPNIICGWKKNSIWRYSFFSMSDFAFADYYAEEAENNTENVDPNVGVKEEKSTPGW